MFDLIMHNLYSVQLEWVFRFGEEKLSHAVEWTNTYAETRSVIHAWVPTMFAALNDRLDNDKDYRENFRFTINDLKRMLFYVECGSIPITTEECDGMPFINGSVGEFLSRAANWNLIDDIGGYPHLGNKSFLTRSGYEVFPLERDSFGWLVGGIRTPKGIVSFG